MAPSFVYTAIFMLTMASGDTMVTEEDTYPSYDQCMMESEASARQMAREWEWTEERTGIPSMFRKVEIRCEEHRLVEGKGHVGK